MNEHQATAVLRALVLTDLVDSTKLVSRLGDERAFALFTRHDRLARDLLANHHGREIDKTDGFLLLFERPLDAVAYTLAYHRALAELGRESGTPLAARAGIHLGEVFLRENPAEDVARGAKPLEVEGLAKPVAARLMALAQGHQTLLTRATFDVARRAAVGAGTLPEAVRWRAHGAYVLKGVEEPLEVFEVGEDKLAPLTPPPDSEKARRAAGDSTIVGWRPAPGQEVPLRPNWVLAEKLGQGGFGEVWLAVHKKTRDRLVFKFCFEAERLKGLKREVVLFRLLKEALGDREDIARVRDWNFEQAPYFLEVDHTAGGSLTDWATRRGGIGTVALPARLEIVAQVAEALAAAHSVGVLHKDLKPANLLIEEEHDGRLQAKLTDFGIGLLTDTARLAQLGITTTGVTELTTGHSTSTSGTAQYMAPEVMEGRPVTVQADIYALGVILYQLVVADLQRSLAPGWEREVGDELLREDIAVCVDGSPQRRLASAAELASRLRHLEDRRVERRQQEQARVAGERARRRRRIMIPAAAALVVFSVAMGLQSWRVAREAARAEREAATSREVSRFLVDLFELADQAKGRGDTITAREILERGAKRVSRELADQPLTQARLMDTIGVVYLKLGLLGKAEPLIRSALDTRKQLLGEQHVDYAASLASAGVLATRQKDYPRAEKLLGQALSIQEDSTGSKSPEVAVVLGHLAALLKEQGRFAEARPLEERVATILHQARHAPGGRAATEAPPLKTVELLRETPLPPDTRFLLGSAPDPRLALMVGRSGVYVIDMEGATAPALAALGPDEEVIGPVTTGVAAMRVGSRLVFRNYFPSDRDANKRFVDRVVFDGLTAQDKIAVDPYGMSFARVAGGTVRAFRITAEGTRLAFEARLASEPRALSASRRFVACIDGREARVWSLEDGRELLHVKDWEGQAECVALEDLGSLAAVGGWFNEVFLYDLESGSLLRTHSASGRTYDLLILPDHPTVVAGKVGRVVVWRDGSTPVAEFEAVTADYTGLAWGSSGLLASDLGNRKLVNLAYRSFPLQDRGGVAGSELWALESDPTGKRVFIGSSDGRLHRFDLATSQLETRAGHTQGVTSIAMVGSRVATASDDKTIALWDPEKLEVVARSKAHEYLVNYLFWEEPTQTLWSTSSDHTVKAWAIPAFTEKEAFRLGEGSKSSMWIDSTRGLAVVGTWNGSWVELKKQGGTWGLTRTQRLPSTGVYCVAAQPAVGVLLMVGVRPSTLWAYDVQQEAAWELSLPGQDIEWAAPLGRDRLVVVGLNIVACYKLERKGGALSYELSIGLSSDLGALYTATALPGSDRIAAGNSEGRLLLVDTAPIVGHVAGRAVLR